MKNNSNLGVYDSEFQGESEYQLYFSIGAIVLWQIAIIYPSDDDTLAIDQKYTSIYFHSPYISILSSSIGVRIT
jgi:hypothetical protein